MNSFMIEIFDDRELSYWAVAYCTELFDDPIVRNYITTDGSVLGYCKKSGLEYFKIKKLLGERNIKQPSYNYGEFNKVLEELYKE